MASAPPMADLPSWLSAVARDGPLPDFLRLARRFETAAEPRQSFRALCFHDWRARKRVRGVALLEDAFDGPYWTTLQVRQRPPPVEDVGQGHGDDDDDEEEEEEEEVVARGVDREVVRTQARPARQAAPHDLLDGRYWAVEPNSRRALRQLQLSKKREREPQLSQELSSDEASDNDDAGDDGGEGGDPLERQRARHQPRLKARPVAAREVERLEAVHSSLESQDSGLEPPATAPLDLLMPQSEWLDGRLSRFDTNSHRFKRRKLRLLGSARQPESIDQLLERHAAPAVRPRAVASMQPSVRASGRSRKAVVPRRQRPDVGQRVVASWSATAALSDDVDADNHCEEALNDVDASLSLSRCIHLDWSSIPSDALLRQVVAAVRDCDVLERPWIAWHALRRWWDGAPPPSAVVDATLARMLAAFAEDPERCCRDPSSLSVWVELYRVLGHASFWDRVLARGANLDDGWHLLFKLHCLARLRPVDESSGDPHYELRGAPSLSADWITVERLLARETLGQQRKTVVLARCVALAAQWESVPWTLVRRLMPRNALCASIPDFVLCCSEALAVRRAVPAGDEDADSQWDLWVKLLLHHLHGGVSRVDPSLLLACDVHQVNTCVAVSLLASGHSVDAVRDLLDHCSLLGLSCVARVLLWRREPLAPLGAPAMRHTQQLCAAAAQAAPLSRGACAALQWWCAVVSHPHAANDNSGVVAVVAPILAHLLDACRPGRLSIKVLRATCATVCELTGCCVDDALVRQVVPALAHVAAFSWLDRHEHVLTCVATAASDVLVRACSLQVMSRAQLMELVRSHSIDRRRAFALRVASRALLAVRAEGQPTPVELAAWAHTLGRFPSLSPEWHRSLAVDWTLALFDTASVSAALEMVRDWANPALAAAALEHIAAPSTAAPAVLVAEALCVLGLVAHRWALGDVAKRWQYCGLPDACRCVDPSRLPDALVTTEVAAWLPMVHSKLWAQLADDAWAREAALGIFMGALSVLHRWEASHAALRQLLCVMLARSSGALLRALVDNVLCPLLCSPAPHGAAPTSTAMQRYWAAVISGVDLSAWALSHHPSLSAALGPCAEDLVHRSRALGVVGQRVRIKALKLLPLLTPLVHQAALVAQLLPDLLTDGLPLCAPPVSPHPCTSTSGLVQQRMAPLAIVVAKAADKDPRALARTLNTHIAQRLTALRAIGGGDPAVAELLRTLRASAPTLSREVCKAIE